MNELIQKLQDMHGLSAEQSQGILGTITGYIKEKVPMAAGMIDNLLHSATNSGGAATPPSSNESTIQKIEDFAKNKLGGFLGGNK